MDAKVTMKRRKATFFLRGIVLGVKTGVSKGRGVWRPPVGNCSASGKKKGQNTKEKSNPGASRKMNYNVTGRANTPGRWDRKKKQGPLKKNARKLEKKKKEWTTGRQELR